MQYELLPVAFRCQYPIAALVVVFSSVENTVFGVEFSIQHSGHNTFCIHIEALLLRALLMHFALNSVSHWVGFRLYCWQIATIYVVYICPVHYAVPPYWKHSFLLLVWPKCYTGQNSRTGRVDTTSVSHWFVEYTDRVAVHRDLRKPTGSWRRFRFSTSLCLVSYIHIHIGLDSGYLLRE